ncbi:hypothetical protein MTP99_007384, partial [Tenebrio molitor]
MSAPHVKHVENETEEEPFGLGCALELFAEDNQKNSPICSIPTSMNSLPNLSISFVDKENSMELKPGVFKYMFVVVNVRGYKVIVHFLPHEVADFEYVLRLLEAQNPNDTETWKQYVTER